MARPAICLNMIVRDEAHIVGEVLGAVAPYISSWVIVDTGSEDGTQGLIRDLMGSFGIPGELHERPWRNFGHNRTEALALAQGHGDYIWQMDADDTVVGTLDFSGLGADIYTLRAFDTNGDSYWMPLLFRDGAEVRWVGATHEYATWDQSYVMASLHGDYRIEDRHLSSRNLSGNKLERDRDLLLADVAANPENMRSVFYLAQTYFCMGDLAQSRDWYARRAEMGGWDEEVYFSLHRVAESMAGLGLPWPDVQDAYLRAWAFRPTRAESMYAIARHYRMNERYQLGHLFARRAAEIPFPESDQLFCRADIYGWRSADEQAVCASWTGKHPEAFGIWRQLIAQLDLPDSDRQRIARNRDVCVPTMIEAASRYPASVVQTLCSAAKTRDADVAVSLVAGPDLAGVEQTLNSFLNCCADISVVSRFLAIDAGLSPEDRALLLERYGFLQFIDDPRSQICERYWLRLEAHWRFFAPENLITRLRGVLAAEPDVFQVAINFGDADALVGACAAETAVRRTPETGRYVLTDLRASGPAMVDTERLTAASELRTASLDEVICVKSL